MKLKIGFLFLAALLLFMVGCGSVPDSTSAAGDDSSAPPFAQTKTGIFAARALMPDSITIPAGTVMSVRLQNAISSASNRSGDEFAAVLDDPLVIEGRTVAPRGTPVTGRVVAARSSGRLHNSGFLRLALVSMSVNGKTVPVRTSSVFAQGGSHKKRNLAMIGGGTGAGALIGAIAGGGKGALIGGAIGAGAGTAGAYATGKKDVTFGAERRITFRLTQALEMKA